MSDYDPDEFASSTITTYTFDDTPKPIKKHSSKSDSKSSSKSDSKSSSKSDSKSNKKESEPIPTVNTENTVSKQIPIYEPDRVDALTAGKKITAVFCSNSKESDDVAIALIIKHNNIKYKCSGKSCQVKTHWLRKPIELMLYRKNGIIHDLRLPNLEFLCPNCYTQSEFKQNFYDMAKNKRIPCKLCGCNLSRLSKEYCAMGYCMKCAEKIRSNTTDYIDEASNNHLLDANFKYDPTQLQKEGTKMKALDDEYYRICGQYTDPDTGSTFGTGNIKNNRKSNPRYNHKSKNTSDKTDADKMVKSIIMTQMDDTEIEELKKNLFGSD